MGVPKLIFVIRRFRSLSSSSSFLLTRSIHSQSPNSILSSTNFSNNYSNFRERSQSPSNVNESSHSLPFSSFLSFRSLSVHASTNNLENDEGFQLDGESTSESEILNLGFDNGSEVAKEVLNGDAWYEPAVQTIISLLDGYHDLTNLPWWVIIVSSTLALRIALLPVLFFQLNKAKRITELFPKLPPPLPPPFSGKSFIEQYLLFRKERQAIGCPSYLWCFSYVFLQIPCFLLWMTTIRRMSLNHHPGFDCGGALWFQNLTELPNGIFVLTFPILIAGLHYINVQISFRGSSVGKVTGLVGLLSKYYKQYLDILTLPIFVIGFCIPQGSLIYWVTNSSLTVIQQLSLQHPALREKMGLPDKNAPVKSETFSSTDNLEIRHLGKEKEDKISVQNLSPDELLSLSVQLLAKGHQDRATPLLRLALEKDPDHVRALVVLGQTFLQKQMLTDATDYLERAISKLFFHGHPTKDEEVDLLILASTWAGAAYIRQGNNAEGLEHLERIAQIKEPEDPKGKAHYFDGLVMLASFLFNEGRKKEAEKYLRRAAAYDPSNNVYLQQCLEDEDNLTSDQRNR
ncbi:Membrane insertase OXA1/ALB3/YidC [Macleaya cordata]|uniref:Membrane insertase OXA1/ALB3/YidC n=1 Tax=Macleaya cordata TaxID=56857 RepID=A0A200R0R4_MACCD|nr:Membrane insertase OXA1/ALB3/YidC [Macleaya cordata]